MFRIEGRNLSVNCAGMSRRSFLHAGVLGLGGLTLPDLLRIREAQAAASPKAGGKAGKQTACILIWLDGGPPQHETYDPKPDAPAEYRGAYGAIETSVKGLRISELLPEHAKLAHRMAFVRSVHHATGDHFAGAHWMLTGRFGATTADQTPRFPSLGSCVSKLRGPNRPDLPAYVGLPKIHSVGLAPGYHGGAYLGTAHDPFLPDDNWGGPKVTTAPMFTAATDRTRLAKRAKLLERVDHLRRTLDQDRQVETMDIFTQRALSTLMSPEVREAFDLDAEPKAVAERYGEDPWSRYTLLARRLVERGVTFVTVNMPDWDVHDNIAAAVKPRCAKLDRAVSALVRDLDERGMLDTTLVVVMGEFGRTPKLNTNGVPGQTGIPGRDHWGDVMSVLMAGGGLRMGQAVGASNANGEHPVESPYGPEDVLATVYQVLGIDLNTELYDRQGRPIPLLPGGAPIRELT